MLYVAPGSGTGFKMDLYRFFGEDEGREITAKILRRIGEEPVVVLGSGVMGVAYGLPSGRVLKLTSDEGELLAMNRLKGLEKPNLIRVFDAFQVPSKMGPMGVIVREDAGEVIGETPRYSRLATHLREVQQKAMDEFEFLQEQMPEAEAHWTAMIAAADALTAGAYRDLMPDEQALIPEIRKALLALLEERIFVIDVSPGNIAIRDGEAVVFDPSFATVQGPRRAIDMAGHRP